MPLEGPTRIVAAAAVVLFAALGVRLLGAPTGASLLAFAGGVAAILLIASLAEPPPPAPKPQRSPDEVLDALIEALAEPVLVAGESRVLAANAAARGLLGAHVVGEDVRVAIRHPAAAERLSAGGEGATELVGLGAREQRWEMRVRAVAPGRRLIQLVDRSGSQAAEKMRVDFVANASHELRTPLAALIGFIETLDDPAAGGDAATRKRFLKVMHDQAHRMQRLVEDLMSLSRIEAEKFQTPDSPVELASLIAEVHAAVRAGETERGKDVVTDLVDGLPPVAGDRAQLAQLLDNLIGNAMKYGRLGTPVTVRLDQDGAMLRLTIADEGEGIAPEHLPRLTERFYRVDSGRSRALGGTGLGLAIVKHIVERHRGRLSIASTPGEGTTVTVLLPPAPGALSSKSHADVTEEP